MTNKLDLKFKIEINESKINKSQILRVNTVLFC